VKTIELRAPTVTTDYYRSAKGMPVIVCTNSSRTWKRISDAGYHELRVNLTLSKALLQYKPEERALYVEKEMHKLLAKPELILVTDFEMLFDPRYKIDVLKIFCDRARQYPLIVKWPGSVSLSKLIYGEFGNPDYHEYDCANNQVVIVR
jgi:hypothetical protein